MDTSEKQTAVVNVKALTETIRRHMPMVYSMISERAAAIGNQAYADVRAGLRGEPSRFYAFEGGRVVGTPFQRPDVTDAVAGSMVRFGVAACVLWPELSADACIPKGAGHGTD